MIVQSLFFLIIPTLISYFTLIAYLKISNRSPWKFVFLTIICILFVPTSMIKSLYISEPCYGQGSWEYSSTHPLQCQFEIFAGIPAIIPFFLLLEIILLLNIKKSLTHIISIPKSIFLSSITLFIFYSCIFLYFQP